MPFDAIAHPHQFVLEARLNAILGAQAYDEAFAGFRLGDISATTVFVWTPDESSATMIEMHYRTLLIAILREELGTPIDNVTVLPLRFPCCA